MKVYKIIKYILLAIGFVGSESLAVFWFIKVWKFVYSPKMIAEYSSIMEWGWYAKIVCFLQNILIPAGLLFVIMPCVVTSVVYGVICYIEKRIKHSHNDESNDPQSTKRLSACRAEQ